MAPVDVIVWGFSGNWTGGLQAHRSFSSAMDEFEHAVSSAHSGIYGMSISTKLQGRFLNQCETNLALEVVFFEPPRRN